MRLLFLSWEYPPQSVGGLARHVEDLAKALAPEEEVHVLTLGQPEIPTDEVSAGVFIHRINPYPLRTPDFLTWVLQLNLGMLERAISLLQEAKPFHLIHAHDWLVAFVARALKSIYRLPLVATIHATEYGRNQGLYNEVQSYISSVEWWLTYEAWRVIVCSKYMQKELRQIFQLPPDKITVIPNGVNLSRFQIPAPGASFRNRYAAPEEKIVFFVGRLVPEKGAQTLLAAAPLVLAAEPRAKFILAGQGPFEASLRAQAQNLGLGAKVYFTGPLDDLTRDQLYLSADVVVVPSYYEPFGIVALEAMAAGTPVVTTTAGGLEEIVTSGVNGQKVAPGDASSLANGILYLLKHKKEAGEMAARAKELVAKVYSWVQVARQTRAIYEEVYQKYRQSPWKLTCPLPFPAAPKREFPSRYCLVDQRVKNLNLFEGGLSS